MARMLKLAKADPEVLNRIKYFRREACQQLKKPDLTPEVAISVTNQKQSPPTASSRVSNKMPPKSAPAPSTTTLEEKLQEEGQTVLNHGSYKNRTFFEAWQDQAYVKWCLDHCTTSSSPGMKKLSSYFREMKANHMPIEKQPTALMAIRQIPGSKEDILAILDTGCNATCHGASWLRKCCRWL